MWESLAEIFAWVWRGSLYAIVVVFIIFMAQALLRRTLSPQWSAALWLILLTRLLLPAGPQFHWSLWNLAPQSWFDWNTVHSNTTNAGNTGNTTNAGGAGTVAQVEHATGAPAAPANDTFLSSYHFSTPIPDKIAAGISSQRLLPLLWLAGVAVMLSGIAVVNLRLWLSIRKLDFVTDAPLLELLKECKRQLGVRTLTGIVRTDRVKSPFLFGFLRPRILLPADLDLEPEQLRCVLLHELGHIRRGDILTGWLLALLQTLHWFNPFIWLAFARMRADREAACDALALSVLPEAERRHYGAALLGMLERFNKHNLYRLPAVAGIFENKAQLKRRLVMITQYRRPTRLAGALAFMLAIVLCGGVLTEATGGAVSGKSAAELAVEQTIDDMLTALAAGDIDRWAEYYVQDDSFSMQGLRDNHSNGFADYRQYMQEQMRLTTVENPRFTNARIQITDNSAWAVGREQEIIRYRDNSTPFREIDGDATFILVKRDGRWLINYYRVSDLNDYAAYQSATARTKEAKKDNMIPPPPPGREKMMFNPITWTWEEIPAPGSKVVQIFIAAAIQHARLIEKVNPVYPEAAKAEGLSGKVRMMVTADEAGQVSDIRVLEGSPLLADAATSAVRQWRYQPYMTQALMPGRKEGPAAVAFEVNITFNADGTVDTRQPENRISVRFSPPQKS